jgi:hypothetical protein
MGSVVKWNISFSRFLFPAINVKYTMRENTKLTQHILVMLVIRDNFEGLYITIEYEVFPI